MKKNKKDVPESLQFAVYGGICSVLGLFSIIFLFFSAYECKTGLINSVISSVVSIVLAVIGIYFGLHSKTREGIYVIIIGITVIIIVTIIYIIRIIPCALS